MRQHPEKSDRDVGQNFKVSAATVNTLRHSAGLQKTAGKGVNLTPAFRNEIADYARQHPDESLASIAGRFNVSKTVVDGVRHSLGQPETPTPARNLTPDRKNDIRQYIRQHPGQTNTDLAGHFNVSKSTITRLRTTGGVPKASGSGVPLTHAQRSGIADYIGQHPGQTNPEIAKHFGVNPVTIYRIHKLLDRLGPHAFSSDAAAGSSALPKGADLHAPSTSGHPQHPYGVRAGASGGRPVAGSGAADGGGGPAPKRPRTDAPPVQQPQPGTSTAAPPTQQARPQPGTSAPGASAGGDPHAPSTSGQQPPPAAPPPHPEDESVMEWMLHHLSPAELDRVLNLPDEQFDREMGRFERLMGPAQQPAGTSTAPPPVGQEAQPGTSTAAPPMGQQPQPGTSTAAPPMQPQPRPQPGTPASGASAGGDPQAPSTSGQQPPPASPPQPAENEPVIEWMLDNLPSAELDHILNLPDEEFQRQLERIKRLMGPAQQPS
jgi:hypothetical protein